MHLWPSMRLRESFKLGYLKNLEWNLNRMDSQKQRGNDRKLLDESGGSSNDDGGPKFLVFFRDLLMILSCCYCCFCCGVQNVVESFTQGKSIILDKKSTMYDCLLNILSQEVHLYKCYS